MRVSMAQQAPRAKLFGRAFYESIGSPKMVVAPMVDRSEFVGDTPFRIGMSRWLTHYAGLENAHAVIHGR